MFDILGTAKSWSYRPVWVPVAPSPIMGHHDMHHEPSILVVAHRDTVEPVSFEKSSALDEHTVPTGHYHTIIHLRHGWELYTPARCIDRCCLSVRLRGLIPRAGPACAPLRCAHRVHAPAS